MQLPSLGDVSLDTPLVYQAPGFSPCYVSGFPIAAGVDHGGLR